MPIVEILIANKADINHKNDDGNTALMYAAQKGHLNIVKYLIENGADVNYENNNNGFTALMYAITKGDLSIINFLIKNGANDNFCANKKGDIALMYAVAKGDLSIIKLLIENGADVNYENNNGFTALMIASNLIKTANISIIGDSSLNENKINQQDVEENKRRNDIFTVISAAVNNVDLSIHSKNINSL